MMWIKKFILYYSSGPFFFYLLSYFQNYPIKSFSIVLQFLFSTKFYYFPFPAFDMEIFACYLKRKINKWHWRNLGFTSCRKKIDIGTWTKYVLASYCFDYLRIQISVLLKSNNRTQNILDKYFRNYFSLLPFFYKMSASQLFRILKKRNGNAFKQIKESLCYFHSVTK